MPTQAEEASLVLVFGQTASSVLNVPFNVNILDYAKSFKQPSPYGTVLIMSPWNYPILLTLDPIVDAIAAGNTAVVKPSAYSPATAKVVKNIISECFTPEYVAVITGGRQENAALLI